MAADPMARHYGTLTPAERFALTVEAMARGDGREADRLGDTCPRRAYRAEDAEYRDRVRRAYVLALRASLDMREGLAQLRMAATFREVCGAFASGPAAVAQAAFLCGRAYGRREAGADDDPDVPDPQMLAAELEARPDLRGRLDEAREAAVEGVREVADTLAYAVGQAHATELLAQWEGFGRFCRGELGVEPLTVLAAFGLGEADPAAEALAACPGAEADSARAAEWEGRWRRAWRRRFGPG